MLLKTRQQTLGTTRKRGVTITFYSATEQFRETRLASGCAEMIDVTFNIETWLTATGLGSEHSSGHILQRGRPNSCGLVSASDRRALLVKLGALLSLLTRLHLFSIGSRNVSCIIYIFKMLYNTHRVIYRRNLVQHSNKETQKCENNFLHFTLIISYISFSVFCGRSPGPHVDTHGTINEPLPPGELTLSNSPVDCCGLSSWLFNCFGRAEVFASPWQQNKEKAMWWRACKWNKSMQRGTKRVFFSIARQCNPRPTRPLTREWVQSESLAQQKPKTDQM